MSGRRLIGIIILAFVIVSAARSELTYASSKGNIIKDFSPACDSLEVRILERTGVDYGLNFKAIMKRGNELDFYFDISLSDIPWRKGDEKWLRKQLKELMPHGYKNFAIGKIYSNRTAMDELLVGELGFNGQPNEDSYRIKNIPKADAPLVERVDGFSFDKGLENRHIALWQSHGLYYELGTGRWQWQRPKIFRTAEDIFTQSFVLPYLVPMLENAGAYVMLPRERDFNKNEIIIDNDPHFDPDTDTTVIYTGSPLRKHGNYSEQGEWKNAGVGFADSKAVFTGTENPFRMGTVRSVDCIEQTKGRNKAAKAVWTPYIEEKGEYAVYVSWKSLPNSSESAHYTVNHAGGKTEFTVNQKLGGGTWIYLGTFLFEEGEEGNVILDNLTPKGRKFEKGSVVCADAVKIGGGWGNVARSSSEDQLPETSGLPRFTESARYWLQWAGADTTIYRQKEGKDDYRDDLMSRGDWVTYLSGGSSVNPKAKEGKGIPFDLTLALHSDAGVTQNDSIIGTLVIYSRESDGKKELPSGESMRTGREYANLVQTQIVHDMQEIFDPLWSRRGIWNRGYRESRTPSSPTVLCELLSHQNFADMRYGHDPLFKFHASRAIYKGMLKYLSNRYGVEYAVQPLPVHGFSASLRDGKVLLEWSGTEDKLEPTAVAEGFLIQTRLDDGGFDEGVKITKSSAKGASEGRYKAEINIEPGHIYSFKVSAYNAGGKSFPSEILSAGIPSGRAQEDSCILIVNNFDRVSAPAWFDKDGMAGFDEKHDSGVPYMSETSVIGEMYQFSRSEAYSSNDNPGFGASYNDLTGSIIAGNNFDYPYLHGKAIFDCGYPFCSASSEAFSADSLLRTGKWCVDIICGKQVSTISGGVKERVNFNVFPPHLRDAVSSFTSDGGNVIISGAYIGTDPWSGIYPVVKDSTQRAEEIKFAQKVLGYKWIGGNACNSGKVRSVNNSARMVYPWVRILNYNHKYDPKMYCVENPDAIGPANKNAKIFLRYADSGMPAGITYSSSNYKTVCIGFPIESIEEADAIKEIFSSSFKYFMNHGEQTGGNN